MSLLTGRPTSPDRPNLIPASSRSFASTIDRRSLVSSRPVRLTHSASADTINSSTTGLEERR